MASITTTTAGLREANPKQVLLGVVVCALLSVCPLPLSLLTLQWHSWQTSFIRSPACLESTDLVPKLSCMQQDHNGYFLNSEWRNSH